MTDWQKSFKFHKENSLEKRKEESEKILKKYPDRFPIIVERDGKREDIPEISKNKYLVPNSLTIGQFVHIIRKRIELNESQALFIFVNNILPPTAQNMSVIYETHKCDDGFLYVKYSGENTFG